MCVLLRIVISALRIRIILHKLQTSIDFYPMERKWDQGRKRGREGRRHECRLGW